MSIGEKLVAERRQEIARVAESFGARNIRVIGSVARGEDREMSDVDLLVTFDPGISLIDHAGLEIELSEMLGRRVDIASDRGLRPRVRERLLRDARPL